jgi:hypothetical protein
VRIVRIFNTYGPRMALDDGRVVSNFVSQALTNQPITIYGDGQQVGGVKLCQQAVGSSWWLWGTVAGSHVALSKAGGRGQAQQPLVQGSRCRGGCLGFVLQCVVWLHTRPFNRMLFLAVP